MKIDNVNCDSQTEFNSCPQISVGNCSVNRRVAFAMRCIGGDRAELETFCGIMDLPPPVGRTRSEYKKIEKSQILCTKLPKLWGKK